MSTLAAPAVSPRRRRGLGTPSAARAPAPLASSAASPAPRVSRQSAPQAQQRKDGGAADLVRFVVVVVLELPPVVHGGRALEDEPRRHAGVLDALSRSAGKHSLSRGPPAKAAQGREVRSARALPRAGAGRRAAVAASAPAQPGGHLLPSAPLSHRAVWRSVRTAGAGHRSLPSRAVPGVSCPALLSCSYAAHFALCVATA